MHQQHDRAFKCVHVKLVCAQYFKLKLCFDFIFKHLQWNDDEEEEDGDNEDDDYDDDDDDGDDDDDKQ